MHLPFICPQECEAASGKAGRTILAAKRPVRGAATTSSSLDALAEPSNVHDLRRSRLLFLEADVPMRKAMVEVEVVGVGSSRARVRVLQFSRGLGRLHRRQEAVQSREIILLESTESKHRSKPGQSKTGTLKHHLQARARNSSSCPQLDGMNHKRYDIEQETKRKKPSTRAGA